MDVQPLARAYYIRMGRAFCTAHRNDLEEVIGVDHPELSGTACHQVALAVLALMRTAAPPSDDARKQERARMGGIKFTF